MLFIVAHKEGVINDFEVKTDLFVSTPGIL